MEYNWWSGFYTLIKLDKTITVKTKINSLRLRLKSFETDSIKKFNLLFKTTSVLFYLKGKEVKWDFQSSDQLIFP